MNFGSESFFDNLICQTVVRKIYVPFPELPNKVRDPCTKTNLLGFVYQNYYKQSYYGYEDDKGCDNVDRELREKALSPLKI